VFKQGLFSLPPEFGQFDMGAFGRPPSRRGMMASPNMQAARTFMGAPSGGGIGSILLKGLGGFLAGRDAHQRGIAEAAAREGMQAGGLGGAIEKLGTVDNYYANQMMNPLVQQQWAQKQAMEQAAQAQAASRAEQDRLFAHQRRMQQERIAAENQRRGLEQAINTINAQRKQAEDFKKQQFQWEKDMRATVTPIARRLQGSTTAVTRLGKLIANPSAASDMAVITLFFKSLDPASTVTQGEMDMIKNSVSISERAKSALMHGFKGHSLTQQQRIEIYNAAVQMNNEAREAYEAEIEKQSPVIEAYGLNMEHILPAIKEGKFNPMVYKEPDWTTTQASAANPFQNPLRPINGRAHYQ